MPENRLVSIGLVRPVVFFLRYVLHKRCRLRRRQWLCPGQFTLYQPKANHLAAILRQCSRAVCRTQVLQLCTVRAAASYFEQTGNSAHRVSLLASGPIGKAAAAMWAVPVVAPVGVNILASRVEAVPVVAPFLNVAVHIVQTPCIRRRRGNLKRWAIDPALLLDLAVLVALLLLPQCIHDIDGRYEQLVLVENPIQVIASVILAGGAGPAGVFPFGLGRQTVGPTFFLGQPLTELHRIVPTDKDNRLIVFLRKVVSTAIFFMRRVELLVLGIGHLGGRHMETPGDIDPVNRTFVVVAALSLAYHKGARFYLNKPNTNGIDECIRH